MPHTTYRYHIPHTNTWQDCPLGVRHVFCLFDGHGGDSVAEYCRMHLTGRLLRCLREAQAKVTATTTSEGTTSEGTSSIAPPPSEGNPSKRPTKGEGRGSGGGGGGTPSKGRETPSERRGGGSKERGVTSKGGTPGGPKGRGGGTPGGGGGGRGAEHTGRCRCGCWCLRRSVVDDSGMRPRGLSRGGREGGPRFVVHVFSRSWHNHTTRSLRYRDAEGGTILDISPSTFARSNA